MTEQKLKKYFENKLTAEVLKSDVNDSQIKTSFDVTTYQIDEIQYGKFEIQKNHLIKICIDFIDGKFEPIDINTIGFAIMMSDFFYFDEQTTEGKIVGEVIFDWDNPEIGYDINLKNMLLWKNYLQNGICELDKNELKEKFRSKGKFLSLYQKIDEILWEGWDPIGINDETTARSEYQSYTPEIVNLYKSNAETKVIAEKLYEFETQNMGMNGNFENCEIIATKIKNIDLKK